MSEVEQLNKYLGSLMLKQEIQSMAIREIVRLLVRPNDAVAKEFCEQMRTQTDELLAEFSRYPDADAESDAVLHLAALLEAAGQPPKQE